MEILNQNTTVILIKCSVSLKYSLVLKELRKSVCDPEMITYLKDKVNYLQVYWSPICEQLLLDDKLYFFMI